MARPIQFESVAFLFCLSMRSVPGAIATGFRPPDLGLGVHCDPVIEPLPVLTSSAPRFSAF